MSKKTEEAINEVVDRIAPIVGFKIIVQDRGETKPRDLLSNKNLGAETKCGNKLAGKKDCMARNEVQRTSSGLHLKKEDSHMYKHCTLSHDPTSKPTFHQYAVGKYKTSIERLKAEAVIIDMRKNTLNSTGYNRCNC